MKRKLKYIPVLLFTFLLLLFAGCSPKTGKNLVSDSLRLQAAKGKEIIYTDSHGGFHNDGTSYVVLQFSDDSLLDQLRNNKQWHPLPMDDTAKILAFGYELEDGTYSPFCEGYTFPEAKNGLYCLIDGDSDEDIPLLERKSFHYSLAMYDTDTKTLYFCKVDT